MTTEETLSLAKAYALAAYTCGAAWERYGATRLAIDLEAAEAAGEAVQAARVAFELALETRP
jgi:hypothetical protein